MNPKDVKPNRFKKHTIVYEDESFSVAYGKDEQGNSRFAMRWNGETDKTGYPNQGGNPLWFLLPNYGIWPQELLKLIESINLYKTKIEQLEKELTP